MNNTFCDLLQTEVSNRTEQCRLLAEEIETLKSKEKEISKEFDLKIKLADSQHEEVVQQLELISKEVKF